MRIGSLFSGYGGLDLAVREVFPDAETVFVADVCKVNKDGSVGHYEPHRSPCTILAHRFPGVPNLGDVALIDWTPWRGQVDVLTAGFPCQDVSVAGGRAGLRDGNRTGLWSEVVRAIAELNPRLVVLENVPGIFTAPAAGDVEPCTWCVGDDPAGNLRALDAVLADLATLGLDADWTTIPASGVGAPHRRERWFCVAYPAGHPWRIEHGDGGAAADAVGRRGAQGGHGPRRNIASGSQPSDVAHGHRCGALLPSPRTSDTNGAGRHGDGGLDLRTAVALLPTPTMQDGANNGGPSQFDRNTRPLNTEVLLLPTPTATPYGSNQSASDGAAVRPSLDSMVRLLPTPRASDGPDASSHGRTWSATDNNLHNIVREQQWGQYTDAIARWERLTRPAPAPTELGPKGAPRLSPRFSEWMMGLADGWITDVPGITRNEALKAAGNGVVLQQAIAALRWLLGERGAA